MSKTAKIRYLKALNRCLKKESAGRFDTVFVFDPPGAKPKDARGVTASGPTSDQILGVMNAVQARVFAELGDPAQRANVERELKLELLQDRVEPLLGLPLLSSSRVKPPHRDRLVSTYFDTPDLDFRRAHASLRVRQAGKHFVQTLKTAGTQHGGVYEREEYEHAISGSTPDLSALRDEVPEGTALGMLLRDGALAGCLSPIFITDVERTVMRLRLRQGDEVELAVDRGVIRANGATAPIRELELEIQAGQPAQLSALALQLLDVMPMRLSRASKGDHGYALVVDEPDVVVRAQPLKLADDDSTEAAFLRIARNCLAQISGNERCVIHGINPEGVHQMRVGLRRLRSALDLFRPLLACPPALEAELRWIADQLGPARDWEVLATSTLPDAFSDAPEDVGADAVVAAAEAVSAHDRQVAAHAVDSERYTRLILTLSHWLASAGWRQDAGEAQRVELAAPVRAFARTILRKRQRKLLKRGRGMAKLDEHKRHRARIAAKKLRYATAFFDALLPAKKAGRYREHLGHLQDDLGWLNDMTVAQTLLRRLAAGRRKLATGCGYARGSIAGRVGADKEELRCLWKRFKAASLPA